MDCKDCLGFITPFIDGELSPSEYNTVQSHLNSCATCSRVMEMESLVKTLIKNKLDVVPAPEGLRKVVLRKLDEMERSHSIWAPKTIQFQYRLSYVLVAAALVCIVFISAFLYRGGDSQETTGQITSIGKPLEATTVNWENCNLETDNDGNVSLHGKIVCIGCELSRKFNIHVDCRKYGHHHVLMTDQGMYVSFTTNDKSFQLLHEAGVHGMRVTVKGKLFKQGNYIDLLDYKKV